MADTRWTASLVEARFEEAAETLYRLPPVTAKPMLCSWPTVIRDFWEAYGWEETRVRLGPPSAAAITRMDEAFEWLRWLEPDEVRVIWLRACGVRWKPIAERFQADRSTVWRWWVSALSTIAARLNRPRAAGTPMATVSPSRQTVGPGQKARNVVR